MRSAQQRRAIGATAAATATSPCPRAAVRALYVAPVAPLLTSVKALAAWTLIPERRWRETLARHPEIAVSKLGRDYLLSPGAVRELLAVLRVDVAGDAEPARDPAPAPEQLETPEAVLELLGVRRKEPRSA